MYPILAVFGRSGVVYNRNPAVSGTSGNAAAVEARQIRSAAPKHLLSLDLATLAPVGHYLALRVGFAFPLEEVNCLPRSWVEHYTRHSLMLMDPVMRWVHTHEGATRWSALSNPDPADVLLAARQHGISFGIAASTCERGSGQQRSFGLFLRSDREFTDQEMDLLHTYLVARHHALSPPCSLTVSEIEVLRLVKEGVRIKRISDQFHVSESAIKQRLRNARMKLDAKTGAEAISRAVAFGLI
jgi:LuxR family transcriptional regulator